MKTRKSPFLFVLLVALAGFFGYRLYDLHQNNAEVQLRSQGFDRRVSTLQFTRHARCRMDCRHITAAEIEEIMRGGEINYAKSNMNDQPCPTFALQGTTHEGQLIRVIFAQCAEETKVVTCYDLEHDFECHCPGDENKNGSR